MSVSSSLSALLSSVMAGLLPITQLLGALSTKTRPEEGLQLRKKGLKGIESIGVMYLLVVYRIKANHEVIRQYRCTVLINFNYWL